MLSLTLLLTAFNPTFANSNDMETVEYRVRVLDATERPVSSPHVRLNGKRVPCTADGWCTTTVEPGLHPLKIRADQHYPNRSYLVVPSNEDALVDIVMLQSRRPFGTNVPAAMDQDIYFPTESAELTNTSKRQLRRVARVLKRRPDIQVVRLDGYADPRGAADTNLYLSLDRARAVRTFLIDEGVPSTRLMTNPKGEAVTLGSSDTNARRVEMVVADWSN